MEFRTLEGEHRKKEQKSKRDGTLSDKCSKFHSFYFCKDGGIWESRAKERDVIPGCHRHLKMKR